MSDNKTDFNQPSDDEAISEAFTLEQLLSGISPENLHEEIPSGPPVGTEVW